MTKSWKDYFRKPCYGDHHIRVRGGPHDGLDMTFDDPPNQIVLESHTKTLHSYRLILRFWDLSVERPADEVDYDEHEFNPDYDQLFYDYVAEAP